MPTYKLTIEYEGTRYSGWQAQGNTPKTIQGHLLRAASQVLGEVDIGGAGRTDAGVHAAAQVAHLRSHKAIDPLILSRKINDLLPHDISIVAVSRANDRFHARHDAISRVYLYQIATRRTAFAKPFVWWIKDSLDLSGMTRAATLLEGRHDFSAFSDKRLKEEDSRIVVVERCEAAASGDLIAPEELAARLEANAANAEPTAPPSGLFLEAVVYPGETFDRPLQPIVPVSVPVIKR